MMFILIFVFFVAMSATLDASTDDHDIWFDAKEDVRFNHYIGPNRPVQIKVASRGEIRTFWSNYDMAISGSSFMVDLDGMRYSIDGCVPVWRPLENIPEIYDAIGSDNLIWTILASRERIQITILGKTVVDIPDPASHSEMCGYYWNEPNIDAVQFSDYDTGSLFFRPLPDDSMCPMSYPYVFARGTKCCAVDTQYDTTGFTFATNHLLTWESEECADSREMVCPNPPCINHIHRDTMYHDLCWDRDMGDPTGLQYRGHLSESETGDPCLPWEDKQYLPPDEQIDVHNHCRNVGHENAPWCFTAPGVAQLCAVNLCPPNNGMSMRNVDHMEISQVQILNNFIPPKEPTMIGEWIDLFHPAISTQYTTTFNSPERAIDGNYDTYVASQATWSQFEVYFGLNGESSYYVHNVTIHYNEWRPDWPVGFFVFMTNEHSRKPEYQVACDFYEDMGEKAVKIAVMCDDIELRPSNRLVIENLYPATPLILREVEVYGEFFAHTVSYINARIKLSEEHVQKPRIGQIQVNFDLDSLQVISLTLPEPGPDEPESWISEDDNNEVLFENFVAPQWLQDMLQKIWNGEEKEEAERVGEWVRFK